MACWTLQWGPIGAAGGPVWLLRACQCWPWVAPESRRISQDPHGQMRVGAGNGAMPNPTSRGGEDALEDANARARECTDFRRRVESSVLRGESRDGAQELKGFRSSATRAAAERAASRKESDSHIPAVRSSSITARGL